MAGASIFERGEKMRRNPAARITHYTIAWMVAAIWLIPFIGIFVTSISPLEEVVRGWWGVKFSSISFKNFAGAWSHPTAPIGQGIRNSLFIAMPATIFPLFLGSLAAYGILRYRFPLRKGIFIVTLLLLAVPQHMVAIPLFQILKNLKLIDSYLGLVLVHTAWGIPWILLFMRAYFSTLPKEIEEAASIDGAGRIRTFFGFIIPMSWPGLASVACLQFSWVWNDFFLALIFIYSPDKLVATQRIPLMRGVYHVDWGILTAAALLITAVPIFIFILLQKYYVKGFLGFASK
jgi:multiple sugar transport system permease protein